MQCYIVTTTAVLPDHGVLCVLALNPSDSKPHYTEIARGDLETLKMAAVLLNHEQNGTTP